MSDPFPLNFSRIAIINRGEAAVRLIHAVDELRRERPGAPLTTIALHTRAERLATFARLADEANVIESPSGANPYLDCDVLERALKTIDADAAWVGWGFVAEHPEFADLCDRLGVTFIGPSGAVMRRLGDKIGAKLLAEEVGVPVAPWSGGGVESVDEARHHAETIGFPFLIKAAAGGGGRGIRRVDDESELAGAFERARDEASKSFGDPTVFLEALVTGARHVEVQVAADGRGGAWSLGVRDCSVQRRNQKIIEESSSPVLGQAQNDHLRRVAADLVVAAGYRNVGTVEFLYQPTSERFAFLEVNTRLQVEHPITELTTGVDLVKLQLELASGRRLDGDPPTIVGHAIEARLNAEDPSAGFAPASGRITDLRLPAGPGIRVDTGISAGESIQPDYDAMVAKVMAWGRDREEARARLIRALEETTVSVEGGSANTSFLLQLLQRPEVIGGEADTAWLDRVVAEGQHLDGSNAEVAVLVAGAEAYLATAVYARASFFAAAARGRPRATHEPVITVDCRVRGEQYRLAVQRISPDTYRIEVDGHPVVLSIEEVGGGESRVTVCGRIHRVRSVTQGRDHRIEVDHVAHVVSRDDAGMVRAPSPSLVIAVPVAAGDRVAKGDSLVVLEAMKMETVITAPFDAVVIDVLTGPSLQVDAGSPLVALEPAETDDTGPSAGVRLDFAPLSRAPVGSVTENHLERHLDLLAAVRWTILGFDTEPGVVRDLSARLVSSWATVDAHDPDVVAGALDVVAAFADLGSLARNRRVGGDRGGDAADEAHNPVEYFHRYLRSLDVEAEGLPDAFRAKLERAFRHYGIDGLDPTVDLQRAAFRAFNAQQEAAGHEPLVAAVLSGLRLDIDRLDPDLADRLGQVLDDLVAATDLRFPNLGTAARNLRYEVFTRPAVVEARRATLDDLARRRRRLQSGRGDATDFQALLDSPEALIELLGQPVDEPGPDPMLEAMLRRLYRAVDLDGVSEEAPDLWTARYHRQGIPVEVVATITDQADVEQALARALERVAASGPADDPDRRDRSIQCFVRWDGTTDGFDELGPWLDRLIGDRPVPDRIYRITFSGADPGGRVYHRSFVPGGDGLVERTSTHDIHPMVGARLRMARWSGFELERLPSRPEVYSYRAVAVDNPRDVRLVVAAEVRDLGTVVDGEANPTALPSAEQVVAACATALRTAQAELDPERRLSRNRIVLYVWPTFDLPLSALDTVAERMATLTAGLGLEGVEVLGELPGEDGPEPALVRFGFEADRGRVAVTAPDDEPVAPLDRYQQNVIASRKRGSIYPYELIDRLTIDGGTFVEWAVDSDGRFDAVDRPPGNNEAGFVAGVLTSPSDRYPDGITRVLVLGDPTMGLASIAEAECRTLIEALDLAERLGVSVEWYAVSAGARIAMDSGTENMDWISRGLRRIVEFTQAGGEINVVVTGINVGAQPYWNAEATMLMHTKGILIMTPDSAMVLTGKQSLDYSGGVSAEDNFGIGGYDRIMGPNGQAQYWAPDIDGAIDLMWVHNERTWVAPGERFPRPFPTVDRSDRDIAPSPHDGDEFDTVGEIFDEATNPGRKKPFDIRSVMRAVADIDAQPLERWADLRDGETGVVHETRLDGHPVMLIGISSRAIPRTGLVPADGPDQWTSGTLFPLSSKKIARAVNAASGNRPVVVLANLSGFDGSPESLSRLQLEYGAEIGRALVNFDGPIVFCVISRYPGGAFVVFSKVLNDNMEAMAVEGTYASVLGGAPAAAVVFSREVDRRTDTDPRVAELRARVEEAAPAEAVELRVRLAELRAAVRAEKLGEKAAEFDTVHTVQRARDVGSVDAIIPAAHLRPELIAALERGRARATD